MLSVRSSTLVLALAAALALPALARAAEESSSPPAASTEQASPPVAEMVLVPGAGMGMGHGPMHGENCHFNRAARIGDGVPCVMDGNRGCPVSGNAAMTDKRLDMLEKRMDMMQMMMEMMLRQQSAGAGQ